MKQSAAVEKATAWDLAKGYWIARVPEINSRLPVCEFIRSSKQMPSQRSRCGAQQVAAFETSGRIYSLRRVLCGSALDERDPFRVSA
jgi:hypothetical protein